MVATRRIIAFSLYGDAPMYLRGAVENARLTPIRYPGWTARFYVSQEIPRSLIEELEAHGAEIVPMIRRGPDDGMFWRFLAADEASVDAVIFRDVDSRLSTREAAAVNEWLDSGRRFHLMRDHPYHHLPIMAGMWGVRHGALAGVDQLIRRWTTRQRLLGQPYRTRGADQRFLQAVVYPRGRGDAMIHSESVYFTGEDVRPFPLPPLADEFVGQIVGADNTPDPAGAAIRAANLGPIDGGVVEDEHLPAEIGRAARHLLGRVARRARRTLRRKTDTRGDTMPDAPHLLAILGSVTPPGRMHRALGDAVDRANAGSEVSASFLDLGTLTLGFADGTPIEELSDDTPALVAQARAADGVVLASPVYRASMTGALKNALDLLPVDALQAKPVGILAMGGSHHHYLGVATHLRDVLQWFGALPAPTDLYLTGGDFADGAPTLVAASELDALLSTVGTLASKLAGAELGPLPLAARY